MAGDDFTLPAPEPSADTRQYWELTKSGQLALPFCHNCDEFFFYPRGRCPHCMSRDIEFREASGTGTVTSYTTVYRPPVERLQKQAPYVNALVELEEGVTMMTNLMVESEDDVQIGMDVSVTFVETDGEYKLPCFAPITDGERDM